jgi:hypothetical protein
MEKRQLVSAKGQQPDGIEHASLELLAIGDFILWRY